MTLKEFRNEGKELQNSMRGISLQEAARMLSVSTATVRNWLKAGKIKGSKKDKGSLHFDREEILTIKHEIESGESHRLKSRRNKRAIRGNVIPKEYVTSSEYLQVAEEILEVLAKVNAQAGSPLQVQFGHRLLLFEVALSLFISRGILQCSCGSERIFREQSFTELALQGRIHLGEFEGVLFELWKDPCDGLDERVTRLTKGQQEALQEYREVLRRIRHLEIQWLPGEDLLGLVHMTLSQLGRRKRQGSYYTSSQIADALVEESLRHFQDHLFPKVIDPCCGSGNFLIKAFIALVKRAEMAGIPRDVAERQVLESCLQGYEIDPIAVSLAKINLVLLLETPQGLTPKIQCKNTLADLGGEVFSTKLDGFDLVIGNPPWGCDFTQEELDSHKKRFDTAQFSAESFSLFIEYALGILKEEGILAYVLPEALLNIKTHHRIRKFLLERMHILEIRLLGHQFSHVSTPAVTLIARRWSVRDSLSLNQEGPQIHIDLGKGTQVIPQRRFAENELSIFNVKASNEEAEILAYLRTLPGVLFLAGNADFAMGIVTGNNKEFLLHHPIEGAEGVLKGNDIFKFNVYPRENYLVFTPERFQQIAPVNFYRAPEKLIYRFINETLVFAYDDRQTLTLNSANLLIPRLSGYSMKYILAVLNSRAAQFFYTASFSSVKVLREHLESIPIPPCDLATQERIAARVDQLVHTHEEKERVQLYEQLDHQIMQLYALTSEQQDIILTGLRNTKYLTNR